MSTSYRAQADEYRRDAARYYARHRKGAQDAARYYALAADQKKHARWLTSRPDIWEEFAFGSPADTERYAQTLERIADHELKSSARDYASSQHYRDLSKVYQNWADEQTARVEQYKAEHLAECKLEGCESFWHQMEVSA